MRNARKVFRRRYGSRGWYRRRPAPPRSPLRRVFDWLLTIAFFILLALIVARLNTPLPGRGPPAGPAYVIDGDTLIIDGRHIRLQGIDAPEMKQICRRQERDYDCGVEARNEMKKLIGGRAVRCSASRNDRYNRLLGDCRVGELDLNRAMVETGWAVAYGHYASEEAVARRERRGIWAGSFERPQDWRREHEALQETPHKGPSPLETAMENLYLWLNKLVSTLYDQVQKNNAP
ncbi:thermonuclease family protein [Paramesorhizobium deserti]|uniref:thermonuclease family protein n=1 Tax=Paramesorhizobium deserti TaxID=1494590 RepID=UPI0009E8E2D3|nr:thermonuclease family protein [Paramesorhizobium deserti]